MTRTASRELDAEVAEKVMGCKVSRDFDDPCCYCPGENGADNLHTQHALDACHSHSGLNCDHHALAYYSTDIAAAWQIIEKLKGYGYLFPQVHDNHTQCKCSIWKNKHGYEAHWIAEEYAASAPLAICLAALKAVEKLT